MKNKDNIIIISSVVAIGLLAILLLKKPSETPQVRLRKLKSNIDKKLMDLKIQRSLTNNFDEIVKIDAEIENLKNKLKATGQTDAITEMMISEDLTQALTKNKV